MAVQRHFPNFVQNFKLKPDYLKPQDKVAILAPAGRVFQEELEENLNFLKSLDLIPILGENLFQDFFEGYHYAGNPEQRIADFQQALDNPEIKAIWCARGGYGSVLLLDNLIWDKFLENPKWIIGYSDITAFHNHVNNWNIPSLHGITVKRLNTPYTEESFISFRKALMGEELKYEIPFHPFNKLGEVQGKLVGGNLSIIYSLLGSKSAIHGENLILFIEDWNENWYALHRMMMGIKRAGILEKIKGLIVGSFTRMDVEEENPQFLEPFDETSHQIIHKFMEEYSIPVCFQFPAGHIGDNRALRMGTEIKLSVTNQSSIVEFT